MLRKLGSTYAPDIWASFFGELMTALGVFMVFPFLTLYLNVHLHITLMTTMAIVSIAPAMGFSSSMVAGRLADHLGRKPLMVLSLLGMALAVLLYGLARNAWQVAAVTVIEGTFGALYRPALNARVADVVTEDRRTAVFSFLRVGWNMGVAVAPAIGSILFLTQPGLIFDLAAVFLALTAVVIWRWVPESQPSGLKVSRLVNPTGQAPADGGGPQRGTRRGGLGEYGLIISLTACNLPVALLYAQAETNLPIHLSHHFANYTHVIAILLLFGSVMVIFLQMAVSRLAQNTATWKVIAFSFLGFSLSSFGFGWAPSLVVLLASKFMFIMGEMTGSPQFYRIISQTAPKDKRAFYFSLFGSRLWLGQILGPLWGGWLMTTVGGSASFAATGLLILAGGVGTVLLLRHMAFGPGRRSIPGTSTTNLRA